MSYDTSWKAKGKLCKVAVSRGIGHLTLKVAGEDARLEIQCSPKLTKQLSEYVGSHIRIRGEIFTGAARAAKIVLMAVGFERDEPAPPPQRINDDMEIPVF